MEKVKIKYQNVYGFMPALMFDTDLWLTPLASADDTQKGTYALSSSCSIK